MHSAAYTQKTDTSGYIDNLPITFFIVTFLLFFFSLYVFCNNFFLNKFFKIYCRFQCWLGKGAFRPGSYRTKAATICLTPGHKKLHISLRRNYFNMKTKKGKKKIK